MFLTKNALISALFVVRLIPKVKFNLDLCRNLEANTTLNLKKIGKLFKSRFSNYNNLAFIIVINE